ncbi:hypothetical protein ACVWZS_000129 [Pseudomonas fragi]
MGSLNDGLYLCELNFLLACFVYEFRLVHSKETDLVSPRTGIQGYGKKDYPL